jgi:HPt (histidine-containing phosphotransfer) domain-containing protein
MRNSAPTDFPFKYQELNRRRSIVESCDPEDRRMLRGTAMDGAGMTPAASDEAAAIDLVKLSEILGESDRAEMREHLDLFFSHFPALIDRLDAAFKAGSDTEIATAAHTAMGAAGMAAAVRLRGLLMRIETAACAGDALDAASEMSLVRSEYAGVQAFVADGGLTDEPR